jgi:meiotic recombination protein SPO11
MIHQITSQATFRSLLSSTQWDKLGEHGLVLTVRWLSQTYSPLTHLQAKGYPDLASRTFLRQIANQAPHVPLVALVDLDPDGIAIMSTYKYGSYRLAHEDVTPKGTPGLSLPSIRWLGVKSHHVSRTPIGDSYTDTGVIPELQGLMKLTARDRTKAMRMLEWDLCAEDGPEQGWRQELQKLLMLNIKAEMQILDELPGGLVSWLGGELDRACEQSLELLVDSPGSDDGMLF